MKDDILKTIEEIKSRGDRLLNEAMSLTADDMERLRPDLEAMRDSQNTILAALEEIRNREVQR